MSLQIAEFTIKNERDVAWAAQRSRLLASLANIRQTRRTAFGKAVTALATQVLQQGGRGTISFGLSDDTERPSIEAVFRCARPASSGKVAPSLSATVDVQPWVDMLSENVDGQGMSIRIGLLLPADVAAPAETVLADWGTILATRTTQSALATSQKRIRDLLGRLEETQRSGVDLQQELAQLRSLNETLELLALVASHTDNAVIILDAAGLVEWVNDGFVRISGYELPDVRGILLPRLFRGPASDQQAANELHEALAAGQGISCEIRHARKSGEVYWASLSVTPVFNDDGALTRWVGIANDVSDRRRAEGELLLAKEAAESASRTKSQFLANMSHEIRTPMNAIIGLTELALETDLSAEQRVYLQTVRQSAQSLLALLNDLLDLSKIEAGKLAIDPVPFSLAEAVDEMLLPHLTVAQQKGLRLTTVIEPGVPAAIIADPTRLRQILTNLVANSVKFTEQGTIDLHVGNQWKTGDEVGLQFRVRDTGIGIPADKLLTIFDSFTQADSSTSRHYGGTGLGLAICKHLIELMGGRLQVESEVGKGSTFHFTLPMKMASESDVATAASVTVPDVATSPRRTLHLLVADDNPANRMLATRILEKRGHCVSQAGNGYDVLEAFGKTRFDVALLDIQMPDMDGFACTERIRRAETGSSQRLPIIAVTAYAMKGDRDRCLAGGMDAYLAKPLCAKSLIALVESLAEGRPVDEHPLAETAASWEGFDFSQALGRLEGDVDIFKEQIAYFISDSPALIDRIGKAIDARDARELHIAAHRLKGLAASFDAHAVVAAAFELEQAGRNGELDQAATAYVKLVHELGPLRNALQHYAANP